MQYSSEAFKIGFRRSSDGKSFRSLSTCDDDYVPTLDPNRQSSKAEWSLSHRKAFQPLEVGTASLEEHSETHCVTQEQH